MPEILPTTTKWTCWWPLKSAPGINCQRAPRDCAELMKWALQIFEGAGSVSDMQPNFTVCSSPTWLCRVTWPKMSKINQLYYRRISSSKSICWNPMEQTNGGRITPIPAHNAWRELCVERTNGQLWGKTTLNTILWHVLNAHRHSILPLSP